MSDGTQSGQKARSAIWAEVSDHAQGDREIGVLGFPLSLGEWGDGTILTGQLFPPPCTRAIWGVPGATVQ